MSDPISDDRLAELRKSLSQRLHEQPRMPAAAQLYVKSAPTVPSSTEVHQDQSKFASLPEPVPEPPPRRLKDNWAWALIGRITVAVIFAALVALLTMFAKPLWQAQQALQAPFPLVSRLLGQEPRNVQSRSRCDRY